MFVRAFAIGLLALFLGVVVGAMTLPWLLRDAVPKLSASAPLEFEAEIGRALVRGSMTVAGDGLTMVRLRMAEGASMPRRLAFVMAEHEMPPVVLDLTETTGSVLEARGALPMPGRWDLKIEASEGVAAVPFLFQR